MGKVKRMRRVYSKEFKLQAVRRVLEDGRGLRETAREYLVTHGMVQQWIKHYLEKGEDGVRATPARSLCDGESPAPARKRLKKPNAKGYIESELPEAARNELRHLRMENAYLKKVSALVRNRERYQLRVKRKLSLN